MSKVIRAFSLDPRVSDTLDEMTSVPGRAKPMNKSRYVNEALDWYMTKNLGEYQKEVIESRNFLIDEINKKRVIIGGLEAEIAVFRKTRFPDSGNNEELACPVEGLNPEITASSNCRCLWCRLKRLLLRSREEQQEQ